MAKGDSTAGQVVGRELHLDLVAGENADVVLAHLSGDRREDVVAAVELDAEHRAREGFRDLAFDLDLLFLARHSPLVRGHEKEARGQTPSAPRRSWYQNRCFPGQHPGP